ncbi:hypothetical protein [Vreelandella titanicae]|nr:hypothetical protein [Halomonas titanicae]
MVSEAHPRMHREAVPGFACAGGVGPVPLGVVSSLPVEAPRSGAE